MKGRQHSPTLVPTLLRGNADGYSGRGMDSYAGAWESENKNIDELFVSLTQQAFNGQLSKQTKAA